MNSPATGIYENGNADSPKINSSGQVITNWQTKSSLEQAFLYTPGAGFTNLGTLGGSAAEALDINDSGQIVGDSYTGANPQVYHAFVYTKGTMTDLGSLFTGTSGSAEGINASGQIVGTSGGAAVLWSAGSITSLSVPSGYTGWDANAISDNGIIAGIAGSNYDGIIDSNGTTKEFDPNFGSVNGINSSGQLVGGYAFTGSSGGYQACVYANGTLKYLGTLGGTDSDAYGINNSGVIVGQAQIGSTGAADSNGYAAFVDYNGVMTNLNTITTGLNGITLDQADGISSNGLIVAEGVDASGNLHVVVLTPVASSKGAIVLRRPGQWIAVPSSMSRAARRGSRHSPR